MRGHSLFRFALLLALIFASGLPAAGADDRFDDAIRTMRRATTVRSTGEHILLLSSLRQLKDQDLQPLFSSLSQTKNPTIQINAVLGLGELSKTHRIDAWKLSQIKDTRFRALAIIQAKDDDLLGADELREILKWDDLSEDLRVYVVLMLVSLDEPVDVDGLTTLMKAGKLPGTRAYAALALRHLGHPADTEAPLAEMEALPPRVRDGALREMLGTVAYMKLRGATPWIRQQLQSGDLSDASQGIALRALLDLDPASGAAEWQTPYAGSTNAGYKVRLALLLLDHAAVVDASLFAPMAQDSNELLASLGRAGHLVATGKPAVEECLPIIAQHHSPSTAWVLEHAKSLPPEPAAALYSAMINDTLEEGASLNDRLEIARLASAALLKLDVAALRASLDLAISRQRRLTVESILSGALSAAVPESLTLIDGINEWISTRAQSLGVIIKARYAQRLTDDDLSRLSLVFRGGGSVTPAAEVQAAWLYLQRTGQQGQALAAILSDLSTSSDH